MKERGELTRRELLVAAGSGALLTGLSPRNESFPNHPEQNQHLADQLLPQHLLPALPIERFYRPDKAQKAVNFILSHQMPNGAFLTDFTKREIVPMDIGHAGLGLLKTGHIEEAKQGANWALSHLTPKGEPLQKIIINEEEQLVDYSGSWWNEYDEYGVHKPRSARGRAEQNGLLFMTIDAICQDDPGYFTSRVSGKYVADHIGNMVGYLNRVQQPDGRFIHRPTFPLAFPEENVRMAEGLRLMSDRFFHIGEREKAYQTSAMSIKAFSALDNGEGFDYGMSYDFLARAMWGTSGRETSEKDILHALKEGKMTPTGVKMYDMKQDTISYLDRSKWRQKWAGEVYETAGTIDGAIALMNAGWVSEGEKYEDEITKLQRSNGGFPTAFLGPFSGGSETIFTAGRYLLLERVKTEVVQLKKQLGIAA
jgi:hypothetical protein